MISVNFNFHPVFQNFGDDFRPDGAGSLGCPRITNLPVSGRFFWQCELAFSGQFLRGHEKPKHN